MKRSLWRMILILLAMTVLASILFVENDYFNKQPYSRMVSLNNPTRVVGDGHNLYIIKNSKEGLVKFDREGTWEYDIDVPTFDELVELKPTQDTPQPLDPSDSQKNNYLLRFGDIVPDDQGGLYTLIQVMAENALIIKYEVICRYTADGFLDTEWGAHIRKYNVEKDGSLRGGTVKALQMQGNQFTYLSLEEGELRWNRWNSTTHTFNVASSLPVPNNLYLSEVLGASPDELLYSTQKGALHKRGGTVLAPLGDPGPGDSAYVESIAQDPEGRVLFLDHYGKSVKRLDPNAPEQAQVVLDVLKVEEQLGISASKAERKQKYFKSLTVDQDGKLLLILDDHVLLADPNGEVRGLHYSDSILFKQWIYWAGIALLVFLFAVLCKILYAEMMPRSIILKQIFILFPIVALCMAFLAWFAQSRLEDAADSEVRHAMEYVVHDAASLLQQSDYSLIRSPRDFMSDKYQSVLHALQTEEHDGRYYMMVHKVENDRAYSVFEDDNDVRMFESFALTTQDDSLTGCKMFSKEANYYEDLKADYNFTADLQNRKLVTCKSEDENGTWLFALGPLFDSSKTKMIGVFEAGVNMRSVTESVTETTFYIGFIVTGVTLLILFVILMVTWLQLRRITKLKESVNELKANPEQKRAAWIEDQSQDQVGELGRQFNEMAASIQAQIEKNNQLRDAYKRYFPRNLEEYLGKEITDLDLGDQKLLEKMTVLVIHIREFRHEVIKDPQQIYDLINNRFLKYVSKAVFQAHGMIGKFLDGGVIALFPNQSADAIQAAVTMRRDLSISVGIGVHRGEITLGVIGADDRFDSSVLSDQVILTSMLERLTGKLGVTLLSTKDTFDSSDCKRIARARYIGKVLLDNKPFELYDVFEADDERTARLKSETKQLFEEGVELFQNGRFYDARERFVEVLRRNKQDKIAELYFFQADGYYRTNVDMDWEGTLTV